MTFPVKVQKSKEIKMEEKGEKPLNFVVENHLKTVDWWFVKCSRSIGRTTMEKQKTKEKSNDQRTIPTFIILPAQPTNNKRKPYSNYIHFTYIYNILYCMSMRMLSVC